MLFDSHLCGAGTRRYTSSIDILALKSFQKGFHNIHVYHGGGPAVTVNGKKEEEETEMRGRGGKQEVDQHDEAQPFPSCLFLSHLAITSISIFLSAFWLIRSNVCVCLHVC